MAYHPEVRSDRFYLLDDAGRVRGMWRVRDNAPALILFELKRRSGKLFVLPPENRARPEAQPPSS